MKREGLWNWLAAAIAIAGFVWLVRGQLRAELDWPALVPDSPLLLLAALLVGALSQGLYAPIFWRFLDPGGQSGLPMWLIFRWHLVGQLARHLPGRFWGIAYQAMVARLHLPTSAIVRANIELMIIALPGNLLLAGVILIGKYDPWLLLPAWLFAAVTLFLLLRYIGVLALALLGRFSFGRMHTFLQQIATTTSDASTARFSIVLLTLLWGFAVVAWQLIGASFTIFYGADMTSLCAYYILAWIVGYLALVVPSGLGVREAAFVVLATGLLEPSVAAMLAVLARLWLMAAELLLAAVALIIPVAALQPAPGSEE